MGPSGGEAGGEEDAWEGPLMVGGIQPSQGDTDELGLNHILSLFPLPCHTCPDGKESSKGQRSSQAALVCSLQGSWPRRTAPTSRCRRCLRALAHLPRRGTHATPLHHLYFKIGRWRHGQDASTPGETSAAVCPVLWRGFLCLSHLRDHACVSPSNARSPSAAYPCRSSA